MTLRIIVGISVFAAGWIYAGTSGLYSALIVMGLLGLICGPPKPKTAQENELAEYEAQERLYERIEHAKKGRAADPTRPGWSDEHPLLLTNEFRRVR